MDENPYEPPQGFQDRFASEKRRDALVALGLTIGIGLVVVGFLSIYFAAFFADFGP